MNDEIKFRVYNTETKEMNKPFTLAEAINVSGHKPLEKHHIVMQYTGLNDKNGKGIYFDDIVKFSFEDKEAENYFGTAVIAETMNGGAGILYEWVNEDIYSGEVKAVIEGGQIETIWEDDNMWKFEIIGNIHENPEHL